MKLQSQRRGFRRISAQADDASTYSQIPTRRRTRYLGVRRGATSQPQLDLIHMGLLHENPKYVRTRLGRRM